MSSLVSSLSSLTGIDADALVLLLAVLGSYPVGLFYHLFLHRTTALSATGKSIFFFIVGLSFLATCYHLNALHSLITCLVCYASLRWLPTRIALAGNFVFTIGYLLVGYRMNQLDWTYSVTWTMPQCILTLRLIAFSFDVYDGIRLKKSREDDNARHIQSALETLPSLPHFLGHCFFPGSLMVGPLIPYLSYHRFIAEDHNVNHRSSVMNSLERLALGFAISAMYVAGSSYWPVTYLQSTEFFESSFWWRCTAIAIVSKIYMYKYILVWLFSEAACIASGISHHGYEYGNVKLFLFETATSFSVIIKAYNVTTNQFAFKYIYRRLKFLGNYYLSQFITLLFLSVWHGFESGYHVAFSNEVLLLFFEKHLDRWWQGVSASKRRYLVAPIPWILGKLYVFYFMGYVFVPFMFLYIELWWPILASIYFVGHITMGGYMIVTLLLAKVEKKEKAR